MTTIHWPELAATFSQFGLDWTLRATAIFLAAWMLTAFLKRSPAAWRHAIWASAAIGVLLLPMLAASMPHFSMFAFEIPGISSSHWSASLPSKLPAPPTKLEPAFTELQSRDKPIGNLPFRDRGAPAFEGRKEEIDLAKAASQGAVVTTPPSSPLTTSGLLFGLWSIGVLMCFSSMALAVRAICRLRSRSLNPASGTSNIFQQVMAANRVGRKASLRISEEAAVPFTTGIISPAIVLPPPAERWPDQRLRAVLTHELSHVQRWDLLWQSLALVMRSLFWFHPLAWLCVHRVRLEAETASDDAVLNHGAAQSDYAELLLHVARQMGTNRLALGVPMLRQQQLERRIGAILHPTADRRPLGRLRFLVVALATGVALSLAAGVHTTTAQATLTSSEQPTPNPAQPTATVAANPAGLSPTAWEVIVRDENGKPIADAFARVILSSQPPKIMDFKSDANGRFVFDAGNSDHYILVYKTGLAPASVSSVPKTAGKRLVDSRQAYSVTLLPTLPFKGAVKDASGRPIAKARIRVLTFQVPKFRHRKEGPISCWVGGENLSDSPFDAAFSATTGTDGRFVLSELPADIWLRVRVEAKDHATRFVEFDPDSSAKSQPPIAVHEIVIQKGARAVGRVKTSIPGLSVEGLKVGAADGRGNETPSSTTDAAGRFAVGPLAEGIGSVYIRNAEANGTFTHIPATNVVFKSGQDTAVEIELIRGCRVVGTVVDDETDRPMAGVSVSYGSWTQPQASGAWIRAVTDAAGTYRFHLPPGDASFCVHGLVSGYSRDANANRVQASFGVHESSHHLPALRLHRGAALSGKLVDHSNRPIDNAVIEANWKGLPFSPMVPMKATSDVDGNFVLGRDPFFGVPVNMDIELTVALPNGEKRIQRVSPKPGQEIVVSVATGKEPALAAMPTNVRNDEFVGIVLDTDGKPLKDALVHMQPWVDVASQKILTDANGAFRMRLDPKYTWGPVRFSKPGYSPVNVHRVTLGSRGLEIRMGNRTYFEGSVLDPKGQPVPNAPIRAGRMGRRQKPPGEEDDWLECKADAAGHYRLYTDASTYTLEVRIPKVGVARQRLEISNDEAKRVDIRLQPGIRFEGRILDSETQTPLAGVRIANSERVEIDATSDADGKITLDNLLPGNLTFEKPAFKGYVRWWSEQCAVGNQRKSDFPDSMFRNLGSLSFELPQTQSPTILMERGVRIHGKVVDPDNKPVADALVMPSRDQMEISVGAIGEFRAMTDREGRFDLFMPGSEKGFRVTAHDGKINQWLGNANGHSEPIKTKPGEEVNDVVVRLQPPCIVRGKVVDNAGKPLGGKKVLACDFDGHTDLRSGPSASTDQKGEFLLRCVQPGKNYIVLDGFRQAIKHGVPDVMQIVDASPDKVVEGVVLKHPTITPR